MTTPAINVQNLTKNYGPVLAVDNITFQVQPGELVGFLGPNGAGKSTCMRILTTWLPASSGYAWLAGYDVMYQSMEVRKRIGYLPESVPLYPEMRVREYLQYRAKLKGVERSRADRSYRLLSGEVPDQGGPEPVARDVVEGLPPARRPRRCDAGRPADPHPR